MLYEGINATLLNPSQQSMLLDFIGTFYEILHEFIFAARLPQIKLHLDQIYFPWIAWNGNEVPFIVFKVLSFA